MKLQEISRKTQKFGPDAGTVLIRCRLTDAPASLNCEGWYVTAFGHGVAHIHEDGSAERTLTEARLAKFVAAAAAAGYPV